MRFCLVSTQPNWGGGEALLWSMGLELQSLGHEVAWMARDVGGLIERIRYANATLLHSHSGRGLTPSQWLATARALRAWAPDVTIANDTHAVPLIGSAAWWCRRPRPIRLAYKHTIFPLRSHLKYRWLSDKLVCVSQAAQAVVVAGGLPKHRTSVIYGGCNPPQHDATARQWARQTFGFSEHEILLICVGNLLACKGHSTLVESMSKVVQRNQSVRLMIAGEGEERAHLSELITQYRLDRHVSLLGYRNDADRLLDAADIVVHPSLSEGLSLVLIQAQMLSKPIVATSVGGTTEVLAANQPEECSAWIAAAGNADSLASQILSCCDTLSADRQSTGLESPGANLRERLARTAARTLGTFGLHASARQLAELAAQTMRDT